MENWVEALVMARRCLGMSQPRTMVRALGTCVGFCGLDVMGKHRKTGAHVKFLRSSARPFLGRGSERRDTKLRWRTKVSLQVPMDNNVEA